MEQKKNLKIKLNYCSRIGILMLFIAMILACTSSRTAVDNSTDPSGSDHAYNAPIDSAYQIDSPYLFMADNSEIQGNL